MFGDDQPLRAGGRACFGPRGPGHNFRSFVELRRPARGQSYIVVATTLRFAKVLDRLRPMDRFRRFDEAYYQRYYEDPKTRVVETEDHDALCEFVFAFARFNHLEMKSVLDVGAGVGLWKRWIEKQLPTVKYAGTEVSAAMCKKYGLLQKDIARWRDRKKHDLIVCQGVLQYLPDPDVAPAVANIAAMSKGLLYLEITTRQDLLKNCDLERTDQDIFRRNGSYYRGILNKHFINIGGGLWWVKDREGPFYELEVTVSTK